MLLVYHITGRPGVHREMVIIPSALNRDGLSLIPMPFWDPISMVLEGPQGDGYWDSTLPLLYLSRYLYSYTWEARWIHHLPIHEELSWYILLGLTTPLLHGISPYGVYEVVATNGECMVCTSLSCCCRDSSTALLSTII